MIMMRNMVQTHDEQQSVQMTMLKRERHTHTHTHTQKKHCLDEHYDYR